MNIDFTKNETARVIGKSHCGLVDDRAISELFAAIEDTSLFDAKSIPSDAIMLAVYAFIAGRRSGIKEERSRRRNK